MECLQLHKEAEKSIMSKPAGMFLQNTDAKDSHKREEAFSKIRKGSEKD